MQYGMEQEFFIKDPNDKILMVPKDGLLHYHMDECGYLVEARGKPQDSPLEAAYHLMAMVYRLESLLKQAEERSGGVFVARLDKNLAWAKLGPEFRREVQRVYGGKPPYPVQRGNMYGKDYSARDQTSRAGLHIHFSNYQTEHYVGTGARGPIVSSRKVDLGILDMPKIIRLLDEAFRKEIKDSRRIRGQYELKPHGFEYRSLPTTVHPIKVAQVLEAAGFK